MRGADLYRKHIPGWTGHNRYHRIGEQRGLMDAIRSRRRREPGEVAGSQLMRWGVRLPGLRRAEPKVCVIAGRCEGRQLAAAPEESRGHHRDRPGFSSEIPPINSRKWVTEERSFQADYLHRVVSLDARDGPKSPAGVVPDQL